MTDGTTDSNDNNMVFGDPHQSTDNTGDNGPVMGDQPAQAPAQAVPTPPAPAEEIPAADTPPANSGIPTPVENSTPEDETAAPSGDTSDTL